MAFISRMFAVTGLAAGTLSVLDSPAQAYDINEWFSINGIVAGAVPCQELSRDEDDNHTCRGGLPFQPRISIKPSNRNELHAKLGFAAGNGLNPISPFVLEPWAADLEDDVKDINGSGRDYILTAWYKHTIKFGKERSLGLAGGIIDSTDYIDANAYANDEFKQFMNEVFVNDPVSFLPSYDIGGSVDLVLNGFSYRAVAMEISKNNNGESYRFYGGQIAYKSTSSIGEGNYRFLVTGTDQEFLNPAQTNKENLFGYAVSIDQELGRTVGVFARFGWQQEDAAINYNALYSGGLNIKGTAWGRADDNVGIGYAYLSGGNGDIDGTYVAEAYYRHVFRERFSITGDIQYMKDEIAGGNSPSGFIFSARGTAEF